MTALEIVCKGRDVCLSVRPLVTDILITMRATMLAMRYLLFILIKLDINIHWISGWSVGRYLASHAEADLFDLSPVLFGSSRATKSRIVNQSMGILVFFTTSR